MNDYVPYKKIVVLVLVFAAVLCLAAPRAAAAAAAGAEKYMFGGGAELPFIADMAYRVSDAQLGELNGRAEGISSEYACDVRVVTVDNMRDFGYNNIELFSNAIYDQYKLGGGPDRSCLLLVLSMAGRDYDLRAWGGAKTAFTYYAIDTLLDRHVLPALGDDEYYKAFAKYLGKAEEYLGMARDGAPFDRNTDRENAGTEFIVKLCVVVFVPALIALIVCLIWRSNMKTAKLARTADIYIPENGFRLTRRDDIFMYRTVTRRKIEQSSHISGGGARSGFGGSSGRSGKF